jgi:hypothetical protein
MKYFELKKTLWDRNKKSYPHATGATLQQENMFADNRIYYRKYVDDAPLYDYFSLISISFEGPYDWILLDAYSFAGRNYPFINGLLVSKKLKEILEKYVIQTPYRFYESRLMFQGQKYEYYIFHLTTMFYENLVFEKCTWQMSPIQTSYGVQNYPYTINSLDEYNEGVTKDRSKVNGRVYPKYGVFKNYVDLMAIFSISKFAISERLKNEIESAGITGLECSPITHIDFNFEEGVPEVL